jgi:hypothetical protein
VRADGVPEPLHFGDEILAFQAVKAASGPAQERGPKSQSSVAVES